jgi:DNA-directed RNA polymerase subunit RPC12/RpoP
MSITCKLFGHKWNGCKCERCDETRDVGHNFIIIGDKCIEKCVICDKKHNIEHEWDGCKCQHCGLTRDVSHRFEPLINVCKQKCVVCGKEQDMLHDWHGVICDHCGEKLNISHLQAYTEYQPTWFDSDGVCTNWYGIGSGRDGNPKILKECGKRVTVDRKENILEKSWSLCKCPYCGFAVHLDLQPDYFCKACNKTVSTFEAIITIQKLADKVKYDQSYLQKVIMLSSRLPAALAASVEVGRMIDVEAANYYFNHFGSTMDAYKQLTSKGRKPLASEIESLFTMIMQYEIQFRAKEKPEKNLFA